MSIRFIAKAEVDMLPEDPEEAFVCLEEIVRERYEEEWRRTSEEGPPNMLMHGYMSVVLPAIHHYGIEGLELWDRPEEIWGNNAYEHYSRFMADVDYCVAQLKLRSSKRGRQNSVALDPTARMKLQRLLAQLRDTVQELDVSVAKKDLLLKKINALQDAVDRERTGFAEFGALMIAACDDAGEAVKRLEPVVRAVERIGAAIGIAKRAEDEQPKLPPKSEPKRIEDKRQSKQQDDEVPF